MADVTGLRKLSQDLTGPLYRLEVGAAIHLCAGEPFTVMSIQSTIGIFYQRVWDDLDRLEGAAMIHRVGDAKRHSRKEVEYKAVSHIYWEFCYRTAVSFGWKPN